MSPGAGFQPEKHYKPVGHRAPGPAGELEQNEGPLCNWRRNWKGQEIDGMWKGKGTRNMGQSPT